MCSCLVDRGCLVLGIHYFQDCCQTVRNFDFIIMEILVTKSCFIEETLIVKKGILVVIILFMMEIQVDLGNLINLGLLENQVVAFQKLHYYFLDPFN